MELVDTIVLDGQVRKTTRGYLVTTARVARTGIQQYTGKELGREDMKTVRVYRPPEEVFHADSLRSFAHQPVTIGHPDEMVDAKNWRKFAVGDLGGEVVREGDFIQVPLVLMDDAAIKAVEGGMKQLSVGYTANLKWESGTTPAGEVYDAIQTDIRANHLAVVAEARGGPKLKIGDGESKMKTILVDGLSVETTDAGAQAIEKLQRDAKTASDKATADLVAKDAEIASLKTKIGTQDGEIAVLKKQVTDSAMTPQKLDEAVTSRVKVIEDARRIGGDKIVVAGKTDLEIKRAAVAVRLGDEAAQKLDDAGINGAFAFAAASDPVRDALRGGTLPTPAKTSDAYGKYVTGLQDGWKTKAA